MRYLRPRQSAAGGNGCAVDVFSGRAGRVPQPPVPTPLGIAPVGLVQPGRGTSLCGAAGGSPTGSLPGALRWRVCISAVRSRAKRSTSASKANWGRCCGFDEARFVPVVRCAAGSTIGASATLGSPKRHDLTAGSFLTRMACRKRGFFPTGGSRGLAGMLRPGPRYATEPMPAARIGVCRRRSIGGARQGGAPGLRRAAADAAIAVCGTKGGSRRCSRTRW